MATTAVEILSESNPLLRKEITSTSEKWEKRTAKLGTIWPMGGTFDPIMYRDMEVVIRNYIDNRSGKTALAKMDREKLVLALFLEEGERWRTLQRVAGDIIANNNKAQPLPLTVESPLHKLVPLYPLLKDNVESKGEVTLDEGDNKCSEGENENEGEEEDDIEHVGEGSSQPCVKHITKNAKRKLKKRTKERRSGLGHKGQRSLAAVHQYKAP